MGLIKNVFKVIGTAGLGIIGAGINSLANLEKKNGLRMACQLKMADPDTVLTEDCEVAFFPRVTGG